MISVVSGILGAPKAVQPACGIEFSRCVYLWVPILANMFAVLAIPFVGNLSDKVGRRPSVMIGMLGAELLSFAYLYSLRDRHPQRVVGDHSVSGRPCR